MVKDAPYHAVRPAGSLVGQPDQILSLFGEFQRDDRIVGMVQQGTLSRPDLGPELSQPEEIEPLGPLSVRIT